MKFKKLGLAAFVCAFALTGCNDKTSSSSSTPSVPDEIVSVDVSGKTETDLIAMNDLSIEVDETYDFTKLLTDTTFALDTFELAVTNKSCTEVTKTSSSYILKGLKEGSSDLYVIHEDQYQIIPISILKLGALSTSFTFDWGRLSNKAVTIFGDSVSYGAGLPDGARYWQLLDEELNFSSVQSFAVGGTTMTYSYDGSHIWEEYSEQGKGFNGVSFVVNNSQRVIRSNYIIIFYGHNDMYFQPDIGTTEYLPEKIEDCNSFKSSYAYALNFIKKNNPYARILLITPNYSVYKPNPSYDVGLTYEDYRQAIIDMANYYGVRYLDIWDDTYEEHQKNSILSDSVHLNAHGHRVVADLIKAMK